MNLSVRARESLSEIECQFDFNADGDSEAIHHWCRLTGLRHSLARSRGDLGLVMYLHPHFSRRDTLTSI